MRRLPPSMQVRDELNRLLSGSTEPETKVLCLLGAGSPACREAATRARAGRFLRRQRSLRTTRREPAGIEERL
jgi:hypothetical protein